MDRTRLPRESAAALFDAIACCVLRVLLVMVRRWERWAMQGEGE